MGARVGAICYASQADALDAYYSVSPPAQAVGATGTLNVFVNNAGVWKMSQYGITSAGVWSLKYSTNAPVVTFATCTEVNDPSTNFFDGMTLGWGVAAAMVAAWGVAFMRHRLPGVGR